MELIALQKLYNLGSISVGEIVSIYTMSNQSYKKILGLALGLLLTWFSLGNNQALASYADVDCTNPSSLTLTSLGLGGGYSSNGPQSIDCTLTTDTGNGSVIATLSGTDYNTSNAELTLHHNSVGGVDLIAELSNPTGFAANGLPLSGTLTPGSPSETPTNFSYDVDIQDPSGITALAGSYSGTVTVTISSY